MRSACKYFVHEFQEFWMCQTKAVVRLSQSRPLNMFGPLMHLKDLGSKSLQPEMHIKATNAKGDSSTAAVVIHWLLCSYASVGLSQCFHTWCDQTSAGVTSLGAIKHSDRAQRME